MALVVSKPKAGCVTKLVTVVLLVTYASDVFGVAVVGSGELGSAVAVAVIVSIKMMHGCGGSVVCSGACSIGGKDVEFPYTVTSCVTVSVVLGAKLKEVIVAQYDTHMLPVMSCVVLGWHPVGVVDVELEVARDDVVESELEFLVEVVVERVVEVVVEFLAEVIENVEVVDEEEADEGRDRIAAVEFVVEETAVELCEVVEKVLDVVE
jgi:hypothetical protein